MRLALLVIAALVGFAANSLLCRAALGPRSIDAATFTAIRLGSGALVLAALARRPRGGSWPSGIALFAYAAAFSFAYLRLGTATGALILFATVQVTMIGWGVSRGERPRPIAWVGIAVALAGLVALTLPGLTAPDPLGTALMTLAGVAWGIYSLRGRGAKHPLAVTADNFARAVPLAGVLVAGYLLQGHAIHTTARGAVLAAGSGALASGLGYTLWYAALPKLAATRAAIVQLAVPVIAGSAGALVLGETLTPRLVMCAPLILGGVLLVLLARR